MQGLIIDQKGHFFEKFHHPQLNPFSNVLHQNKALHNFYKGGQRLIARCIKCLD